MPFIRAIRSGIGLASFGIANLVLVLGFAVILTDSDFGRFAVIYAAGFLLAAFPAYGIGPYILSRYIGQGEIEDIRTAFIFLGTYVLLITALAIAGAALRWDLALDLLAVYLLFLGNTCYAVAEQLSRGLGGVPMLVRQRLLGSMGLVGVLAVVPLLEPSAIVASSARGIALLLVGLRHTQYVPPLRKIDTMRVRSMARRTVSYFVAALFMIGIQSMDKLVLSLSLSLAELGRYAALFWITYMVGNRLSDLAQVISVERARVGRKAFDRRPSTIVGVIAAVFAVILLVALFIDNSVLHAEFSFPELAVFAVGATLLFLSDVLWWTDSITRGDAARFALVSVTLLCGFVVLLLVLPITRAIDVGYLLGALVAISTFLASWSLRRPIRSS